MSLKYLILEFVVNNNWISAIVDFTFEIVLLRTMGSLKPLGFYFLP